MHLATALALAQWSLPVEGTSMYIARLCRGVTCTDTRFPVLDWDPKEHKCVCHQNPCWTEGSGTLHSCPMAEHPFLTYSYDQDGTLSCGCRESPFYMSVHLARDLCPTQHCDSPGHPILDYDEQNRKCVCRVHPCWDQAGYTHSCENRKMPILRYREDFKNGKVEGKCECLPRLEQPPEEKFEI